jgi:hypothetical protein
MRKHLSKTLQKEGVIRHGGWDGRPRWERSRERNQSSVRIWVKNNQYSGRPIPNICFSICLGRPGGLKPAAFHVHVNEYFSSYSWMSVASEFWAFLG